MREGHRNFRNLAPCSVTKVGCIVTSAAGRISTAVDAYTFYDVCALVREQEADGATNERPLELKLDVVNLMLFNVEPGMMQCGSACMRHHTRAQIRMTRIPHGVHQPAGIEATACGPMICCAVYSFRMWSTLHSGDLERRNQEPKEIKIPQLDRS